MSKSDVPEVTREEFVSDPSGVMAKMAGHGFYVVSDGRRTMYVSGSDSHEASLESRLMAAEDALEAAEIVMTWGECDGPCECRGCYAVRLVEAYNSERRARQKENGA